MKKRTKLLSFALCFIVLCSGCFGCSQVRQITADEAKFKKEYESLNGKKTENGKPYLPIFLEEKSGVEYKSEEEIISILKKGTGVIYLGFPECPWCRNALPVLLDTLEEEEYYNFYYLNAKEMRDVKHLDETGKVITDKEGSKSYYEMIEILKEYLNDYNGLNDSTVKRIYLPTVIFVKEGKIKGVHTGTLESQKDPYQKLTESEEDKLEEIYENYIQQVKGTVCGRNGC